MHVGHWLCAVFAIATSAERGQERRAHMLMLMLLLCRRRRRRRWRRRSGENCGPASTGIFLEALFFSASILEPDLNDAHVQVGLGGELLAYVTRRLGARVVGLLEHVELLGRYGGARPLVVVVVLELLELGVLVVGLAYELVVVGHQVELVARLKLHATHLAHEALEMIHVGVGATHRLCRRNAVAAAAAFRAEFSIQNAKSKPYKIHINIFAQLKK